MKRTTKICFRLLIVVIGIVGIACSSKRSSTSTKDQIDTAEFKNAFYPRKIYSMGDSMIAVNFSQTAMAYYLNSSERETKRNLKILKNAQKKGELVYVKATFHGSLGEITEVKRAPADLTRRFQETLKIKN